ncbi:MAG: phosphoribosylaminoimidazolesuccinocarboxamide synthase [Capsulimonadales bacterium]|nr:phosphoribosylaminoimidazolesuccinocarboxamide synthase [Capsulimonadales bacterium]
MRDSLPDSTDVVLTTEIPGLTRVASGKVRDIYEVGEDALLLVATDRISAFDVVMRQGIPDKGRVLTQLSVFWFETLADVLPNHLITAEDDLVFARLSAAGAEMTDGRRRSLSGRCLLCRRTRPLPIEAVVRGYLSGSAWKEYRLTPAWDGVVQLWGVAVPSGLLESERLPQPIFTPSTKAIAGHDQPIPVAEIESYIGAYATPVRDAAVELYQAAREYAENRGILLADTKFEFGTLENGSLLLIDEALTPDSSRFWAAESYRPGGPQPSFDKQFVRDFLETVPGWNKQAPAPDLPEDIVAKTTEKYREAYRRLTGRELAGATA